VVQAFLPPYSHNEVKSEVQEKQAKLRSNLELFIKNLTVCHFSLVLYESFWIALAGTHGSVSCDRSSGKNVEHT